MPSLKSKIIFRGRAVKIPTDPESIMESIGRLDMLLETVNDGRRDLIVRVRERMHDRLVDAVWCAAAKAEGWTE